MHRFHGDFALRIISGQAEQNNLHQSLVFMKKYFVTGLILLLPLTLTLAILIFVFNLLTVPFLGFVKAIFDHYSLFEKGFLFLTSSQLQNFIAQVLILVCLGIITIGLGFIVRWLVFRSVIKFAEYIVKKIPLVRSIYKTTKEVTKTIFTSSSNSFKQVVMVRFPNQDSLSLGLITREEIPSLKETLYHDVVSVFVPTTPNPTSGFLILYKKQDLIYLNMTVEDAFKYIISCGLVAPPFHAVSRSEATSILAAEESSIANEKLL